MPDANTFGMILVGVAVGAFVFRVVAARSSSLRPWANIGTIVIAVIMLSLIGLFASTMVGGYIGGLPD